VRLHATPLPNASRRVYSIDKLLWCACSFWIDKFCIDQTNIQDSLKYLPVFVMASKKMLILAGPTYFTRLCE
jgi:hypothetical protein